VSRLDILRWPLDTTTFVVGFGAFGVLLLTAAGNAQRSGTHALRDVSSPAAAISDPET
jgi:hypothetical protein